MEDITNCTVRTGRFKVYCQSNGIKSITRYRAQELIEKIIAVGGNNPEAVQLEQTWLKENLVVQRKARIQIKEDAQTTVK